MSLEDAGSKSNSTAAGSESIEWRVSRLIERLNQEFFENDRPRGVQGETLLDFIGREHLSPDMVNLLAEARGYVHREVSNPNYTDAKAGVLVRKGEFTEFLIDSKQIAYDIASIADSRDQLRFFHYLTYFKTDEYNVERYLATLRNALGGFKRSLWSYLKSEAVTALMAGGSAASALTGHGEASIALGCTAYAYYLGQSLLVRSRMANAYNQLTSLPKEGKAEVGLKALMSGLGTELGRRGPAGKK